MVVGIDLGITAHDADVGPRFIEIRDPYRLVLTNVTDRQLAERFAASRDQEAELAFAALVQRHGPMVLRVCGNILRNHQDAQDAFQATFLILARKAGTLWVQDSLGPWLHGVACRVAICSREAAARRRRHERRKAETSIPFVDGPDDEHDDLVAILHVQIGQLPGKYRVPIVLCDLEGETYESAAQQLGCPVGTIKSRLARGRERLRNRILRQGADLSPAVLGRAISGRPAQSTVSSTFLDATARLAAQLQSGPVAIKAAPPAIVGLIEGVLRMMLVSKVKTVAACVVVGCGLLSVPVLSFGPGSRADRQVVVE